MKKTYRVCKRESDTKTDVGYIPYKFLFLEDAIRVANSFNDKSIVVCCVESGWKQVYPKIN